MQYVSSRPLLVAIGPAAVAQVESQQADLTLIDAVAVNTPVTEHEVRVWLDRGFFDRTLTSCLVDIDAAGWHDTLAIVTHLARTRAMLPVWVTCMSRLGEGSSRLAQLRALATRFDACVIDPGTGSPLVAAVFAAAALQLPGLVCCHPEDIGVVAHAGAVGRFVTELPRTLLPEVTGAFASIEWDEKTSLHEINDVCVQLQSRLSEDCNLIVAATEGPPLRVSAVLFTS